MTMLLALDSGFGNTKLYFKFENTSYVRDFESRVKETNLKTDSTLIINDKMYDFKDAPLATEMGHKTKEDEIHRVLRNKALYEVYKITGEKEFDIITNCSLDSYKKDRGQSIKQMNEEEKSIQIEDYFGEKVTLKINKIECYAENLAGLIISNDINLAEDTVIAIDIGTKNLQVLKLAEGKLIKTYSSTLGMNQVYLDAFDVVKTVTNKINSPSDVKSYLRRTHKKLNEPIPEIDEAIYKSLETEIFPEIDNVLQGLDSLYTKYIYIGGGSDYLQRFLIRKFKEEKEYDSYFTKDSYFANAIGLYARGEKLLGYKNGSKIQNSGTKGKSTSKKKKETNVKNSAPAG